MVSSATAVSSSASGFSRPLYISSRRWYEPFSRMSIFGVMRSSTLAASALRFIRIRVIHIQSLVAVTESSLFDTFMHSTYASYATA